VAVTLGNQPLLLAVVALSTGGRASHAAMRETATPAQAGDGESLMADFLHVLATTGS
jgi:hypothetical protein